MTIESLKILVIRRDNIGDLVCTTPMIRALRMHFPTARLCVLVNSYNVSVLQNNPDVDTVYAYVKAKHREPGTNVFRTYWDRGRLLRELRRERFDYAIIAGAGFLPRALRVARFVNPTHIVGFIEPDKRGARYIDIAVPHKPFPPMHEAEDVFRLLAPLGIHDRPPDMQLIPSAAAVAHVQAALQERGLENGDVIGVHISARKPSNRWPADKFTDFIQRLAAVRRDAVFILLWAPGSAANPQHPGDDEIAQKIRHCLNGVRLLSYRTESLEYLIAALSLCRALVCSDGGAMHLAAAFGKPILCFFGNSDKTRWYPWRTRHVLLQPPSRDVADITVDEALRGFEQLLSVETPGPSDAAVVARQN